MNRPKIARAMDHLDDDLIAGAVSDNKKISKKGARTMKNIWTKVAAAAASLAILAGGGIFLAQSFGGSSMNANAIVALDVNPSIEIEVNENNEVVRVEALNDDARIVIGDKKYETYKLDVVVDALIGSMLRNGYLSVEQNSILISVDSQNAETAAFLQESISQEIAALLMQNQIDSSVITQTFEKKEQSAEGVSAAKATLIQRIVDAKLTNSKGLPYTYDELVQLNVNELKLLIESKDAQVDGIQSSGSASESKYIGKEQALTIAYEKASVTADLVCNVEIELDFEKSINAMLYEIEFDTAEYEYEYEIDAITGAIIDEDVEIKDPDDDDDDDGVAVLPDNCIEKQAALAIAYEHANVTADNAKDVDCDLESFNGKSYFSIEFEANGNEYEYAIDSATGEILHSKMEKDD